MENVEIFIDAEYLLQSLRYLKQKPKGVNITKDTFNWSKFIEFILKGRKARKVSYYTARLNEQENKKTFDEQTEYLKKIENELQPYNISMRLGRMSKSKIKLQPTWDKDREYKRKNKESSNEFVTWIQKGVDSKIVLDMSGFKVEPECENYAILVAGDEDFTEVISVLNDRNVITEVVAFDRAGSHAAKSLTENAKQFAILNGKTLSENDLIIK